jgi:hypothetical protein
MPMNPTLETIPSAAVYWMVGILGLCLWALLDPKAQGIPKILALTSGLVLFTPLLDKCMALESAKITLHYDYYLFNIDERLGVSAFSFARWLTYSQRVWLLGLYQTLPLMIIAWYALHVRRRDGTPTLLLTSYIIMFVTGPIFYLVVPGVGPRLSFPDTYPVGHPIVPLDVAKLHGWPNAMPSLHVSTALLFVLFAGRNPITRWLAWTYLAGTVAATLALEHYLIDLIVALPFTCFVITLAERRFRAALGYLILVLAWLLTIRFLTPMLILHPFVLRAVAAATVGTCGFYMRRIPLRDTAPLEPSMSAARQEVAFRLPAGTL